MKPTTEDFLITFTDALDRVENYPDTEMGYVADAIKLRIRYAIKAKAAHDKECQRLADEWVEQNKAEYFERAREHRRYNISASDFEYRCDLDTIWNSMRDEADPIFRDYVTTFRPTA